MDNIKSFFHHVRLDILVRIIVSVAMAIFFFVKPIDAMVSLSYVIAIFVIIDGVVSMFVYFFSNGMSGWFGGSLLGSIFKILFGAFAVTNLGTATRMFSYLFAFYIIITAIGELETTMFLKRGGRHYIPCLILSSLTLVGGIIILFLPVSQAATAVGIIAGITLMISAIEDSYALFQMYHVKRTIKKVHKDDHHTENVEIIEVEPIQKEEK